MNRRRHLALTTGWVATAAFGSAWLAGCAPKDLAPNVTFTLLDGSSHSLESLRGRVVLVNFWATTCTSCVKEMPELAQTHVKFAAQGYETRAVAMSYDPPDYVANFAQTRKLPFGVALDGGGAVAKAFGDIRLTPTSFLIDKRGAIVKRYVGPPDFTALHTLIEQLLVA